MTLDGRLAFPIDNAAIREPARGIFSAAQRGLADGRTRSHPEPFKNRLHNRGHPQMRKTLYVINRLLKKEFRQPLSSS